MGEVLMKSLWARVGPDWDVFSEELWSAGYCGSESALRLIFRLCKRGEFGTAARIAVRNWF